MSEMEYNTDELRTGGKHADAASESAENAKRDLQGAPAGGSPFGDVNGGDALHGAVGTAQQHHSMNAQTTGQNMDTAAVRARGTADLGDDNTAETTQLAPRSEEAHSVAEGM
jgi:hypothetical protein